MASVEDAGRRDVDGGRFQVDDIRVNGDAIDRHTRLAAKASETQILAAPQPSHRPAFDDADPGVAVGLHRNLLHEARVGKRNRQTWKVLELTSGPNAQGNRL